MRILACDTSTEHAVFAVGNETGELLGSVTFAHGRHLSRRFFLGLANALELSQSDFASIDVLAVGIGPGSFTGIRCALSIFRTLSQACNKPLIGLGTLDIYAMDAAQYLSDASRILAVLPSRKNEVYAAIYAHDAATIREPFAATPAQLRDLLERGEPPMVLCGQTDCVAHESVPSSRLGPGPAPASLARLAALRASREEFVEPSALLPIYVVAPAISLHKSTIASIGQGT